MPDSFLAGYFGEFSLFGKILDSNVLYFTKTQLHRLIIFNRIIEIIDIMLQ